MPFAAGDDDETCARYSVEIPGDDLSVLAFSGALAELAKAYNWEELGTWTATALAETFRVALGNAIWTVCEGEEEEEMLVAVLSDVKAQNTAGGTFTSGAWRTRTLNTEIDPDSLVTLTADQFTLIPGTFFLLARVPAYAVTSHQARLYNVTGDSLIKLGSTQGVVATGYASNEDSIICALFEIAASQLLEIQHRCIVTNNGDGMGKQANIASELYTEVVIIQVE